MIQKAIIEQKIDKYSMRVRIPVYNKIKSDPTATPTDELYVASIQTLPGCSPNYQEGDVVLVDFENDNIAYPVIIGLLYRQDMSEGSTDITADSLTVNVNTNLSENTLIGNVTPESIQKLNDKYTNNVKKVVIEYSLSNYEDHYDMFSQWSEQAPQYWPNKYMWQRTTVTYENDTITRSMTCIQGAKGDSGSTITIQDSYVKYAISSSGTTPPSTTAPNTWFVNPPQTTDVNPYLWSWTYIRYSDGHVTNTFGVSRVSENSTIVYLYKRSASTISQIDWNNNLTYDFDSKQLVSTPTGWSESIPSGNDPIYVTAATASSIESTDSITPGEWSTPLLFTKSGFNSKTILLYKRGVSTPAVPSVSVTYTFSNGSISPASPDGWSLAVPTTDGNPCFVTQATAISYDDTDTILTTEWSTPSVLARDGNSDYIDEDIVDWYIATSTATPPTTPTTDIEVATEWTSLGWTNNVNSITLSDTNKYLWNAEVTHYTISGYVKNNPHIITIYAEAGKGIDTVTEYYALSNSTSSYPEIGSASWQTTPLTPISSNRYLWNYEVITYTVGSPTTTTPAIICMYAEDGQDGKGIQSITNYYLATDQDAGITTSSQGWTTTIQSMTAVNKYLWNYEVIAYTRGTPTTTTPCIIGVYGDRGNDGVGVQSATVTYAVSDSGTTPPQTGWSSTFPSTIQDGQYLWTKTVIQYTNNTSSTVYSVSKDGVAGRGISSITNYYAVSSNGSTAPSSWQTTVPTMTATDKYLWNYEVVSYSDGSTPTETAKRVIGVYGDTGSAGKGISSIVEYYLASPLSTGVTTSTTGWTTTIQTVDATKKYLWNYEVVNYTEGTPFTSTPVIIGTFSNSITSSTVNYAVSNSGSVPPETGWQVSIPTVSQGQYLWTRTVTGYTDGTEVTSYSVGREGLDGTNGKNNAVVYLYKRSSTAATINWTSTLTYTFSTHTLNSVPSGWNAAIPSGTDPLYVTAATASSNTATDTIAYTEWATPVILSQNGTNGTDGTNGTNTATIFLYQRALSAASLTKPSSTLTYTFSTGTLTGALGNWSQSIPTTNGNPCFVIQATAISTTATDTITSNEWSEITELVADGEDGEDGKGIVSITEYYAINNSSTTPPAFGSSDWSTTPQTPTALKRYLWNYEVITYTYGDPTTTAARVMGMYSEDGAPGTNTATVFLYQRAASSSGLSKPSSTLTYTFATGALTGTLGNWSQTIPATNGNPCFVIQATAIGTGTTDTIQSSEWSNIVKLIEDGQDGTNGTDGINTAVVYLYKRSSTAATIDWTTTLTYTFSSKSLSPVPSGWSTTIPSGSDPIYVTAATAASNQATDDILYTEWATPVILAQNGQDGIDGLNNAVVYLYKRSDSAATIDWNDSLTYDFENHALTSVPAGWSSTIPPETLSGLIAVFTSSHADPLKSFTANIDPMQSGSGDPAPDNVRPISGRTGATILHAGVNLFNKTTATLGKCINGSGGITNRSGTDAFYSDFIPIYAEVGMRFRHTAPGVSGKTMRIVLYDRNKNWIRGEATPSAGGNTCAITIKQTDVDAGAAYLRISAYSAGVYDYAMCTVGDDVAQEYSPYVGTVYPVTFPSEAGTVYGGALNVTTGLLTVDRVSAVFDGSDDENWTVAANNSRKYIAVADIDTGTPDTEILNGLQSNMFKAWSYSGGPASATANTPVITGRYNIAQINVFYNGYNTVENWKAYLSSNNLQVVYPLAVPITYQLTPQEVNAYIGVNTIWSDCGEVSVTYRADPIYITAATASSNTSTDTISYNEWSAPVMLAQNGLDGSNGVDGVNSATVFLYQRSATTPTAKPTGNSTYTFATGILTGTLGNWTQAIPASNGNPCYVIQATAVNTGATDTIAASEWSNIVRFVADGEDGDPGKGITQVINRYLAWPNDTGVTRSTSGWTTTIQTVTSTNKYLWNYEEIVYTDNTSSYTDPCIIGVYGDTGVGIASVTEYYALSTTTTRPTTGWTTTLPTMDATNRYLWNYSLITYTDGSTSGSQADALIIGAYGESVLSLEIESDNGTLFNSKTTSTTLTAAVYLGVTQLTVNNNGSVSSGGTTVGQLNWFAKERFTGNGTAKTFDLGLTILNYSTTPNVTITINGTATSAYTITDNDTVTFTNAPANNSVIDIQYLTSSSKSLQIDRTDVRNQIIITCKLVSGANVLTLSEITIKDLNDATSLKNWYMLTVDGVEFVSLPTVVYNENDSTVIPTGSYDYDDSGTTVTEPFTWLDTEPVVNETNLTKLCYFFSMIIFSDGSCSAGNVERNSTFDSAVANYLAAQAAGDAAGQAQDAADQAQETANGASEQGQENSEAITGIQQTLVSLDGVLQAKLDTVTFTPYQKNIDNFMQFDTVNGIMTIGSGNFKQQLTATKNSFLEGSTEVAYISNQELYINNTTINQKMTLDSQWVITFDSTNGLIVKHM